MWVKKLVHFLSKIERLVRLLLQGYNHCATRFSTKEQFLSSSKLTV